MTLTPKVKVIGKKAGICDGVPSTAALVFYLLILGKFFSDSGSGDEKKTRKKTLKMTSWLVIFRAFFFHFHFQSFFFFFFNIGRTNSKISKVNQHSVLNL